MRGQGLFIRHILNVTNKQTLTSVRGAMREWIN